MNSPRQAEPPVQQPAVNYPYSATQTEYLAGYPNTQPAATTYNSAQNPRFATNGYQYRTGYAPEYNDAFSYMIEDQSTSARVYNPLSSSEHQPEPRRENHEYRQDGQYYLPSTSYPLMKQTNYDSVLTIDTVEDEYSATWAQSSHSEYEVARSATQESDAPERYSQGTNHAAHSPTARRWSREYSPDERMRVGLPRWETEQDRLEYYEHPQIKETITHTATYTNEIKDVVKTEVIGKASVIDWAV